MARLQSVLQGHYEVKRLLGRGGMGAVFLAHDLALDREVAIKVLPPSLSNEPQFFKRFQQEARTAARLDHSNIIPIYRVGSEGGLNFFVMKYVSGTSLETILESKQPLSDEYIQRILWEACCALGHAHSRGVVHRDVKPANIMFDHDGKVMLADFGISKALESAGGLTGTGMIVGTPQYISPEQAKGQPVDGRADQYSLGVVGYRMVTGLLPFTSDSVHNLLYKHIFEEVQPIVSLRGDVPGYLYEPIHRALNKIPDERFATMEDFATAVWPEQPVTAKTPPKPLPQRLVMREPSASSTPTEPVPSAAGGGRPHSKPISFRNVTLVALAVMGMGAGAYVLLHRSVVVPPPMRVPMGPAELKPPSPSARSDTGSSQSTESSTTQVLTPSRSGRERPTTRQRSSPAPSVQPQVEWGYLSINAEPFGTVFIDGVNEGTTPIDRLKVKPGLHTIRIENPGYKTRTDRVQVDPGNEIPRTYALVQE
jgi:serine/threonine-protein kinase